MNRGIKGVVQKWNLEAAKVATIYPVTDKEQKQYDKKFAAAVTLFEHTVAGRPELPSPIPSEVIVYKTYTTR